MNAVVALFLAAAVTLPLGEQADGCALDSATVVAVPPATVRIVATYACSVNRTCWERWVEHEGKIMGKSRVCDSYEGDKLAPPIVPETAPPS